MAKLFVVPGRRHALIAVAVISLAAAGSAAAGGSTRKPVAPKGGLYAGTAKVPYKWGTPQHPGAFSLPKAGARGFGLKVDGGKRRVFNIVKNPCIDPTHTTVSDPGSGSHDADVPKKHPRYGAKISRSGKLAAKIKFRDRKQQGGSDRIVDFDYRISGRFTSSTRARGHLSVTAKVTHVYPGTTTQMLVDGQPSQQDFTCRTGRVPWTVKKSR